MSTAALFATRLQQAGRLEESLAFLPDLAVGGNVPFFVATLHGYRAQFLWAAGRGQEARREFEQMKEQLQSVTSFPMYNGQRVNWQWGVPYLDGALAALADDAFLDALLQSIARLDAGGAATEHMLAVHLLVQRQMAEIELRAELWDRAGPRFARALAWCEANQLPVEAGRCLLGLAGVAKARGDRNEAARHLDRALALFRAHGAVLYADQAIAAMDA
jgi:tetratricopeptide (TPR) repeat protein